MSAITFYWKSALKILIWSEVCILLLSIQISFKLTATFSLKCGDIKYTCRDWTTKSATHELFKRYIWHWMSKRWNPKYFLLVQLPRSNFCVIIDERTTSHTSFYQCTIYLCARTHIPRKHTWQKIWVKSHFIELKPNAAGPI